MGRLKTLRPFVIVFLLVILITVGAFFLRVNLTLANFAMIYLLLVLVVAVQMGTQPALATAVTSFVCINFFLIPPYYTLLVADPREVLDLIVFLIVAVIAGRLGARARQQAREARQREYDQEILYRLTRAFNQLTKNEGVYDALIKVLREDLGAREARIRPYNNDKSTDSSASVHFLLLRGSEHIYGTVQAVFETPLNVSKTALLNTCVSQAAMALQRIDLTERAIKSQQFEEADKLKTAILHAVSHDLRTPITIIKTSASNLRQFHDRLSLQEEQEIAETIENETDTLDMLVGNLLDMSRLQVGALSLNKQPDSLEEIAEDTAAKVRQRTKQERLSIIFPANMPLVPFDYGLMLQVVTNLVENSLRYQPPERKIEIRGEVHGSEAHFKVINHGQTISREQKDHIMEPFYHGREGRTGLGLPIAKGIVEAHHGRLWVEDTPGSGATFIFALPLDKDHTHET